MAFLVESGDREGIRDVLKFLCMKYLNLANVWLSLIENTNRSQQRPACEGMNGFPICVFLFTMENMQSKGNTGGHTVRGLYFYHTQRALSIRTQVFQVIQKED